MRNYSRIAIKDLFTGLQKQMESRFETARKSILHDPTKGSAAEKNWLAFFNDYLPHSYKADSSFLVDYRGELSEQIDIVIYDRHLLAAAVSSGQRAVRPGRECVRGLRFEDPD